MSNEPRWLEEPDCGGCGRPVRRDDRRGIVDGRLGHLDCVPRCDLTRASWPSSCTANS